MIHAGFPELPRMDLVFLVPVGYITLYGDYYSVSAEYFGLHLERILL